MDVPSSRCGFLVVQSYESRLVPGSRLSPQKVHNDDEPDDDGEDNKQNFPS